MPRPPAALVWQLPLATAAAALVFGDLAFLVAGWAATVPAALLARRLTVRPGRAILLYALTAPPLSLALALVLTPRAGHAGAPGVLAGAALYAGIGALALVLARRRSSRTGASE